MPLCRDKNILLSPESKRLKFSHETLDQLMTTQHHKYVIIGAGPTGLGAAHRLKELGEHDFCVLEANAYPGGLAASFKDKQGFTWDIGGHVVFSHYPYFDALLDTLLGSDYNEHMRICRIRMAERWTPYPFQNNIRHLPKETQWDCVEGLLPGRRPTETPSNFSEWIQCVFGSGLAKHFMNPYNFKVWATPLEQMSYTWIGERVSVIDLESVLRNVIFDQDNVSWGPNNTFRFPGHGGTGAIYNKLADSLGDRVYLETPAVRIDLARQVVSSTAEREFSYDYLLNTGPLDLLTGKLIQPETSSLHEAAGWLTHNSVFISGVGAASVREDDTCWMYFPESNCPFYRVTNFHNYSAANVPNSKTMRALMSETSHSAHKQENLSELPGASLQGLVDTGLLSKQDYENNILSTWDFNAEYAYPIPTIKRDQALKRLHDWLRPLNIYSRGRFGGWKYEVGNMDHSLMQGVEWAEHLLLGKPETTYSY